MVPFGCFLTHVSVRRAWESAYPIANSDGLFLELLWSLVFQNICFYLENRLVSHTV